MFISLGTLFGIIIITFLLGMVTSFIMMINAVAKTKAK